MFEISGRRHRSVNGGARGRRRGRPLAPPPRRINRYFLRANWPTRYTGACDDRGGDPVKLNVEIWRHADEPDLIHLTHDRFHAQVTDKQGRLGYYPTLYKKLSELLDESGEPRAGGRQRGEGKRARRPTEQGGDGSQGG
jgi:hypothetical protein